MTRIAILSDVHANTPALLAVAADLATRDVDAVAYLGDIVFRGPDPGGSIELMASLAPVAWIAGNTDAWYTPAAPASVEVGGYVAFGRRLLTRPQREFLGELPERAVTRAGAVSILCVHGLPRSNNENVRSDSPLEGIVEGVEEDVVVCGHTHVAFAAEAGGVTVFNVGSVGMPFDGDPRACYGIVDGSGARARTETVRVAYDAERTLALGRQVGMPQMDLYERTLLQGIPAFG